MSGSSESREISGAEELLLETLGLPFLAFVLNLPAETVAKRFHDAGSLEKAREDALGELTRFLGTVPHGDPFQLDHALATLGTHQESLGSSWPVAAHLQAGGSADLPATTDDLSSSLGVMARDAYPVFLLPPLERFALRGPTIRLFDHPERQRFEDAVMADPTLSRLFPQHDDSSGHSGQVFRTTGSGGGIQLWLFAETLVKNAWQLAVHRYGTPTLTEFATEAIGLVPFLRDAVEGKKLTVPALIGITGIRVPAEPLKLPWGTLRAVSEADKRLIPPGLAGKLQTTTADGQQVEIDYAGDAVMEMDVPYAITLGDVEHTPQDWPVKPLSGEIVERCLETLRLALLLTFDEDPRPIAAGTWQAYLDPLATGMSMSWRDPRTLPYLVPTALTEPDTQAWVEWTKCIDKSRAKGTDIAVRRTLLAAAERPDPTDALVDAVIAWENLVGSSQGEPTLRISSALAWLLGGTEAKDRLLIRKKVAQLYGLRSKVVHGDRVLKPSEAHTQRQDALDITLRAMRILFRDRPGLLTSCKDSTERSVRLILDAEISEEA